MKIHYLEIVSPDVEKISAAYEASHDVQFGEADPMLGGARTCELIDGSVVGIRKPLREIEPPTVRPYWLVDDIEQVIDRVVAQGGIIAMPPTEIPGRGRFAIYLIGGIDHGLWQR